ncbi:MAG: hypothetical protein H7Y32_12590 [Chloroflexales bacterium]|nr:hypothetical protein [Chloroflexales bacterium]
MRTPKRPRLFAAIFSLLLASILGVFASRSWAAGSMFVYGPATFASPAGQVSAGFQDTRFGIEVQSFQPFEPVLVSFTFPDGRVFSPIAANVLDGVVDMPVNFPTSIVYPFFFTTSAGGNYYSTFQVDNTWPYGLYTFTARGVFSGRQTSTRFAVIQRNDPLPNSPRASLRVEDNTTGDTSSLHGGTADIFGRGYGANEDVYVWITAPDGSVIDYPFVPRTDYIGSFATGFLVESKYPTGRYAVTAKGSQSGYQEVAFFDIAARASVDTDGNWTRIDVAVPFGVGAQGANFEVQGKNFDPFEPVGIWLTLPDNSVRGLPTQLAENNGQFYAVIHTDERLPTGVYKMTASGVNSGRLHIAEFTLTQGSQVVDDLPPNFDPVPEVIENGTPALPGTQGPTDTQPGVDVQF